MSKEVKEVKEIELSELETSEGEGKKSRIPSIDMEPLKKWAGQLWQLTKEHGPVYAAKTAKLTGKLLVYVSDAANKAGERIPTFSKTVLSLIAVLVVYAIFSFMADTYYLITHSDYILTYLWHQSPLLLFVVAAGASAWKKNENANEEETK